jgi:vancomycin permeability regulator SanA
MINRFFTYVRSMVIFGVLLVALLLGNLFSFYNHNASIRADCAVIFGAAVWPGYYGPVASSALLDRTLAGAELYKQGLVDCIILSGADSVYGAHEVDIMTDILLSTGVPESIIELDREGLNTLQTIEHLNKDKSYILVSNDFHLARIGLLAQRYGLGERGFNLEVAEYNSGRYAREWYFIIRELVAWVYYFFTTLI